MSRSNKKDFSLFIHIYIQNSLTWGLYFICIQLWVKYLYMIIYFQSHKVYVNVTVSMPFKQHQVIIVNKILKTKWSIKYGQTRTHKTKGKKDWLVGIQVNVRSDMYTWLFRDVNPNKFVSPVQGICYRHVIKM